MLIKERRGFAHVLFQKKLSDSGRSVIAISIALATVLTFASLFSAIPVQASSHPSLVLQSWVFSSPAGSVKPGDDVNCIALTNAPGAVAATCRLFGPPGSGCEFMATPHQPQCASVRDLNASKPAYRAIPLGCSPFCKEFDMTVPASAFTMPGKWHMVVAIFDAHGRVIPIHSKPRMVTVLSMFVMPESQIGSLALIGTSLSAFAGFYFSKNRKAKALNARGVEGQDAS